MLRRSIDETTHRLRELESPQESDSSQTFLGMGLQELPGLAQRLAMLVRDVRIAEALFELLSEQYEQARIQETRDTPTFSVLDWAENGGRKVFPRRLFVAIAVLCSTFGLIAGWILLRVYMNQLQTTDPEQHAALMGFYRTLRGGKPQTTSGEHK
ncbi:MAG TPA: hypothetical protein VLB27_02685, partial [candidate division Zixibacteria bacterium]|nr:hypothetical protein [candidate division Zixibacteria bacterium]